LAGEYNSDIDYPPICETPCMRLRTWEDAAMRASAASHIRARSLARGAGRQRFAKNHCDQRAEAKTDFLFCRLVREYAAGSA
jgi:hypothetical protein